jgi:hypothetical protein
VHARSLIALLAFALAGCAGTPAVTTPPPAAAGAPSASPATTAGATPSPAPTPTSVPTPTPEDQLIAACRHGKPVPWAAPYAGKVHPLVVVEQWWGDSHYSDYPSDIDVVDASYAINAKWRKGTWTSPIQLVVCNPDPKAAAVRVASCGRAWKRTDGVTGELLLYQYTSKIRVVVAATGKTLQSKVLRGNAPTCGDGEYSLLDLDVDPPWKKFGLAVTPAQVSKYATTVSKQKVK